MPKANCSEEKLKVSEIMLTLSAKTQKIFNSSFIKQLMTILIFAKKSANIQNLNGAGINIIWGFI